MPTPLPPDSDRSIAEESLPVSPREAAMRALVYRRLLREKPRESLRRIAGWVGTIIIHLLFLIGFVLGPAYVPPPSPPDQETTDVLKVRLIDKPPAPLPPRRGTQSRAPVVQTTWNTKRSAAAAASGGTHAAAVASATKASRPAKATPAAPAPPVKPAPKPAAPAPNTVAEETRPPTRPKAPPKQPQLEQVPVPTQAPPDLAVDTPRPEVVPPKFQPEPVRKAQVEGTEVMPPPASLAIPPTPASQVAVTPTPPQITSEHTTPVATSPITLATVPRPEVEASSAPPTPQDEPLPAIAQEPSAPPRPDLAPADRPVPPKVSVDTVRAPAVDVQADLEAVPLPDAVAKPDVSAPVATTERPAVQAPAVTPGEMQRPVAGADTSPATPGQTQAPGENPTAQSTAQATNGQAKSGEKQTSSTGQGSTPAPAPGPAIASASGTNTPGAEAADSAGRPGSPNGVDDSQRTTGANGSSQRDDGVVGGQGDKTGQVGPGGAYTELKPRGNVTVQQGQRVHIEYKATRFDKDWTPKNESSVDTAVRQAAGEATVHSTLSLPRGLRLNCTAGPGNTGGKMNAVSLFTLGCGGDPPSKPDHETADNLVKNQTMAPAKPLAADLPPANAATVAHPVAIDNTAFCATARVAGGPLPPGCEPTIKINVQQKTPAPNGSWVPASDQFK